MTTTRVFAATVDTILMTLAMELFRSLLPVYRNSNAYWHSKVATITPRFPESLVPQRQIAARHVLRGDRLDSSDPTPTGGESWHVNR